MITGFIVQATSSFQPALFVGAAVAFCAAIVYTDCSPRASSRLLIRICRRPPLPIEPTSSRGNVREPS